MQGISYSEPRSFAINGLISIGKTTLASYIHNRDGAAIKYRDFLSIFQPGHGNNSLLTVYLDLYKKSGDQIFESLLEKLEAFPELGEILFDQSIEKERLTKREYKEILSQKLQILDQKKVRLVVCLDHFDKAFETLSYDDDVFLRNLANRHAFIIFSEKSLSELSDPSRHSPLQNILIKRHLGLLNEEEAKELVNSPALHAGRKLSEEEVDFLIQLGGFHPYVLTIVCEYVYNLGLDNPDYQDLIIIGSSLAEQVRTQLLLHPAIHDLFAVFWSRLENIEQRVLYKVAKGGASLNQEGTSLRKLLMQGLITFNLHQDKHEIFSSLFQDFVMRQEPLIQQKEMALITQDLRERDRSLLEYLITHSDQLCTFGELHQNVWGDPNATKRAIDASIHRIRKHLEEFGGNSNSIQNVYGKGFRYVP